MDSILPPSMPSHAGPGALRKGHAAAGAPDRTVAITYGTYDLFHIGHVRLFERIKQRFGTLIVAVSTDEFNAVKGKRSVVPFADRLAMVQACRHVDSRSPRTAGSRRRATSCATAATRS